jgi:hypothetical protein
LNALANKPYVVLPTKAILDLHGSDSKHVESVPVHEALRGQTVWPGDVEVFILRGHPKAKWCYAWSHPEGENDKDERFVVVLEIPPVVLANTAVKAVIVSQTKNI